jgi:hypothetical protein
MSDPDATAAGASGARRTSRVRAHLVPSAASGGSDDRDAIEQEQLAGVRGKNSVSVLPQLATVLQLRVACRSKVVGRVPAVAH